MRAFKKKLVEEALSYPRFSLPIYRLMKIAALTSTGYQQNMIWVNDVPEESSKLIYAADMSAIAGVDISQFSSIEAINAAVLGFFFSEAPLYEFNPLSTLVTEMGPAVENGRRESRQEGKFTLTLFKSGTEFQLEIKEADRTNVQRFPTLQECIDFSEEVYYDYREKLGQSESNPPPTATRKDSPTQYLDGRSILENGKEKQP